MTDPLAHIRQAHRPLHLLGVVLLAVVLAACGDDSGAGTAAPDGGSVEIQRSRFSPVDLTTTAGANVEFTNLDPFDHTVTSSAESPLDFDSAALGEDETFTQRFDEPGTYEYFCEIHPTMRGSIVVASGSG